MLYVFGAARRMVCERCGLDRSFGAADGVRAADGGESGVDWVCLARRGGWWESGVDWVCSVRRGRWWGERCDDALLFCAHCLKHRKG